METQGGNGRAREGEREREREKERVMKSVAFVCKMISKNHKSAKSVYIASQKACLVLGGRGLVCLYILDNVENWSGVTNASLTHTHTDNRM